MPEQITQLQNEVRALKAQLQALAAAHTVPFPVESAFKKRLIKDFPLIAETTQSAQTVSVDEGGAATHTVAAAMDGFVKLTTPAGVGYYVPYYTV